jgi:hypothetical protein
VARLDLDEIEAEQPRDRRGRQAAVADRAQNSTPGIARPPASASGRSDIERLRRF